MTVTVRYFGQAQRAAGVAVEEVSAADGCTAEALLRLLAERHGEALRRLIVTDAGRARPSTLLFVGAAQVEATAPLRDGDAVTLLTPMAGG